MCVHVNSNHRAILTMRILQLYITLTTNTHTYGLLGLTGERMLQYTKHITLNSQSQVELSQILVLLN